MHHPDAKLASLAWCGRVHLLAVDPAFPAVRPEHSIGDPHQGRLPRPIFAQQRVDLATGQNESGVVQSLHGAESPGNAGELQQRIHTLETRWMVMKLCGNSEMVGQVIGQCLHPKRLGSVVTAEEEIDARLHGVEIRVVWPLTGYEAVQAGL